MGHTFKLGQRVRLASDHQHPYAGAGREGTIVSVLPYAGQNVVLEVKAGEYLDDINMHTVDAGEESPLAGVGTPCYYAQDRDLEPVEDEAPAAPANEDDPVAIPTELLAVLRFIQRNNVKVSEVIYDYTVSDNGATGQVNFTITEA